MKKIDRNKHRILNITHFDTDGAGSSIILANIFNPRNIEYRSVKYMEIDNVLRHTSFGLYDYVILTDISPTIDSGLINNPKIVLLDHHDTALSHNSNKDLRIVKEGECATLLTKKFCELYFDVDLSYLNDFCNCVNDYDMWILNDPKSHSLNELYYYYWDTKFRTRFNKGDLNFSQEELRYINERKKLFREVYDAIDVYELEGINGVFLQEELFLNDVATTLLTEENYDFVFIRNPKLKTISIRTKDNSIHIGNILSEMKIGGGHKLAAAISKAFDIKDTQLIIEKVIKKINEEKEKI